MNKRTIAKILEDIELLKANILKYSIGECSIQQITKILKRIQKAIEYRKVKKKFLPKNVISSFELLIRLVIIIIEQLNN